MEPLKISIIVPCYNVERYIDRCMQSIVNQTLGLSHLEIIVVNDASTDGTLERLQVWESQYPESIMVITYDENLRQGGARNIGMSYATGYYLAFVDADDWIAPNMYEILLQKMESDDYDVVNCRFIRDYGDDRVSGFTPEWGSICTGLYKRNLIMDNEIFFPQQCSYEDNYWGPLLRCYIKRAGQVEECLYHYFVNQNSTVTKRNDVSQLDRMAVQSILLDEFITRGIFEERKDEIFKDFLELYYLNTWYIIFTRFDDIPDVFPEMIETMGRYFPDYRQRVAEMTFSDRSQMLVQMLLAPESYNVYEVKLEWLTSWLKEQGCL